MHCFSFFFLPIKVRAGTIKLMAGMSLFLEFLVLGQRPPRIGVDSALSCYLWREVGSKQLLRLFMATPGRCVHYTQLVLLRDGTHYILAV